jgi:hypothetical protein
MEPEPVEPPNCFGAKAGARIVVAAPVLALGR